MNRWVVGAAITLLALITYFAFPGHTWLQSDMQIYSPILEHMKDPSILGEDILAQRPHVAYTLYDETALFWVRLTGWSFERVLTVEQIVTRALGIWGIYLIAASLGLATGPALLVAATFSLGATIMGPAVLTLEYEPVPRGFAIGFLLLAVGLLCQGRPLAAGASAAAALLMHVPTSMPFCVAALCWLAWPGQDRGRRVRLFIPMAGAAVLLYILSRHQAGVSEPQEFFARLPPWLEILQRRRGSYNWISLWWDKWLLHYVLLWVVTVAACWRLRAVMTRDQRIFLGGIPLLAILTVPASYLLLEGLKWSLMPQVQPMRSLLFVTAFAGILAAIAGYHSVRDRRLVEASLWFLVVYLVPANRVVGFPAFSRVGLIVLLATCTVTALWMFETSRSGWQFALAMAAGLPFVLIPTWGSISNYPGFEHPALTEVARWAGSSTPKTAVFLFPDSGEDLRPGVFRTEALRAVYVDWKGGGQVNFLKQFAAEWWGRWQKTMDGGFDPARCDRYRGLGIDYLIVARAKRMAAPAPVFENDGYVVYAVAALGR